MLEPYIIEEIRRREQVPDAIQLPLPMPELDDPEAMPLPLNDSRGVVVIEF